MVVIVVGSGHKPTSCSYICIHVYTLYMIVTLSTVHVCTLFSHPDGAETDFESRYTFNTDLPPPGEWTEGYRTLPSRKQQGRAGDKGEFQCFPQH